MILVWAVVIGFAAGFTRAKLQGDPYQPAEPEKYGLLLLAVLPQAAAFFLPGIREKISDRWIPLLLIASQLILLGFVWVNRNKPGMWILGLGLALNLLVISLNDGWMPISPETLISQGAPEASWQIGARHGFSKDLVLQRGDTTLWILSDILTLPQWIPYRVAFSIGDVVMAIGAFVWLFQHQPHKKRNQNKSILKQETEP